MKSEYIGGSDVPSFQNLLSLERFAYRARLVHSQMQRQLKSPLFYELHSAEVSHRLALSKAVALAWRAKEAGRTNDFPSTTNFGSYVIAIGGSSMGNVGFVLFRASVTSFLIFVQREERLPSEYPIRGNVGSLILPAS